MKMAIEPVLGFPRPILLDISSRRSRRVKTVNVVPVLRTVDQTSSQSFGCVIFTNGNPVEINNTRSDMWRHGFAVAVEGYS